MGSGSGSNTEWLKGGRDGKTIMVSTALVSKKESYKRILHGSDFVLFCVDEVGNLILLRSEF